MSVSPQRIRQMNSAPLQPQADYVLYWSQMNRRVSSNHALLYAGELANQHGLPVLVYEALTYAYEYANDRLHTFILEAVPETAKRLHKSGIGYVFYLRRKKSDANDTFYTLAKNAAAVVTDDYPTFIAREHNAAVPAKVDVAYYVVDASCIVPMSEIPHRQYGAYTIRPRIHRLLPAYLMEADALKVKHRYSAALPAFHTEVSDENIKKLVAACDIDHAIAPSNEFRGGALIAEKRLRNFLEHKLRSYANGRNEPSENATSHMSPYLHFGQISALEIALQVSAYAKEHKLMADEYLEELIVRRELAFNYARFVDDPGDLKNLPDWCQLNMQKHAKDKRDPVYTPKQFEQAETHDELWNACQREMLQRGKIHGYYRMYWGKKIIEWSKTYEEAAKTMIDIHGRYALDGRDPNTYTNIFWCFGLHDRPWPERPIFGKMRFMSLDGMKRKTNTQAYIDEINGRSPAREKQQPLWTS
jgi:deoxyribodipyrimidine photo-lyase